jgi:hypothetical protein
MRPIHAALWGTAAAFAMQSIWPRTREAVMRCHLAGPPGSEKQPSVLLQVANSQLIANSNPAKLNVTLDQYSLPLPDESVRTGNSGCRQA